MSITYLYSSIFLLPVKINIFCPNSIPMVDVQPCLFIDLCSTEKHYCQFCIAIFSKQFWTSINKTHTLLKLHFLCICKFVTK